MADFLRFLQGGECVVIPQYTFTAVGDFFEVDIDYTPNGEANEMPFSLGYEVESKNFIAISGVDGTVKVRLDGKDASSSAGVFSSGRKKIRLTRATASTFEVSVDGTTVLTVSPSDPENIPVTRINRGTGGSADEKQWCTMDLYGASSHDRIYDLAASSGSTLVESEQDLDGVLTNFVTGGFVTSGGGNTAPTANAGVDQSSVEAGSLVTLDGSLSSDDDDDSLTYTWAQESGDSVVLDLTDPVRPVFTAPTSESPQILSFSLTVNDGTLNSQPDLVSVEVLASEVLPPEDVGYDVILLVGQSNMVGRYGSIDPVLDATDSRVMQYGTTRQTLELAENPLDHRDEGADTVGLGLSLGKAYADNYLEAGRKVLLVPAAKGGTGFSDGYWVQGGQGYNNAIGRANEAIALGENSRIVLIAWHQGEKDNALTESEYANFLDTLISEFRGGITGASDVPFIVGEIPTASNSYGAGVDAALNNTTQRVSNTGFVTTEDLSLGNDSLHFTAESCRTMGSRYATEYGVLLASQPPIVSVGSSLTAINGETIHLSNVTASNYDSLLWSCTSGQSPTFSENTTLNPYVTFNEEGVHTLQLLATNTEGVDSGTLTVTVSEVAVNTPPTVNAGINQTLTAGQPFQLTGQGTATQQGATIVAYNWTEVTSSGVVLSSNSIASPTGVAPSLGSNSTITYSLTVTDSNGLVSDPDTVSLSVAAVELPTVTTGVNTTSSVGQSIQLVATASNYDALSWSCTSGQSPTFTATTILSPIVTFNEVGVHTFELTATNVRGSVDSSLDVTVTEVVVESELVMTLEAIPSGEYLTRIIDVDNNEVLFNNTLTWTSDTYTMALGTPLGTNCEYYAYDPTTKYAGLDTGVTS